MNENVQTQLGLNDKEYGKFKLFNRLLISYNDFKRSHETASLLLSGNYYDMFPQENRALVIALNMAAIVSYARPFLNSRGELAHNRLPGKMLKILNSEEKDVHSIVLKNRNTAMAHSDADENGSIPLVLELSNSSIIVPSNASVCDVPLKENTMRVVCDMSFKLQEYCFELRQEMEPEMFDLLPKAK